MSYLSCSALLSVSCVQNFKLVFVFIFSSIELMISQQTLNLFIASKQCRQWSYSEIPHLSSILCALYFLLSWQYILFSWCVCGNCKVRIAGQWLCQHDFYFLFYSSLCCWGLIKVKCSHMTHEVAWLTNASPSLFRGLLVITCPWSAIPVTRLVPWKHNSAMGALCAWWALPMQQGYLAVQSLGWSAAPWVLMCVY